MINGKEAQFWPAQNSVMVTEVIRYPALLSCRIWLAGGEYVELREIEKQVIEWARGIGCTRMELSGRRGWARKLAEDWNEVGVIMAKGIKNE